MAHDSPLIDRHYRPIAADLISQASSPTGSRRTLETAVYQLNPIECRQVLIEMTRLIASGAVQLQSPRQHGTGTPAHRCDRPECADANRAWYVGYRRRHREVAV